MEKNEIEKLTLDIFRNVFNVEEINKDTHFIKMGGKSIDAMKIQIELRKQFGVKIDFKTLYQLGSIYKISEHILEKMEN